MVVPEPDSQASPRKKPNTRLSWGTSNYQLSFNCVLLVWMCWLCVLSHLEMAFPCNTTEIVSNRDLVDGPLPQQ
jgi:hypothetical protein